MRGYFGDPRTQFRGPPSERTIMSGKGAFAFHSGIDIVAAAGQRVYPVLSGTVRRISGDEVGVDTPEGRTIVYWHIRPSVSTGDAAVAGKTVLGRVLRRAGHLHFGEFVNGTFINPLARGHLQPFVDRTRPHVRGIQIRQSGSGAVVAPILVRGTVKIAVDAFDSAPGVPGEFAGFPVAPVLVKWRLQTWKGQIAIPETIATDFRTALPARPQFWRVYARGTYQNDAVFGAQLAARQPGRLLFNLAPKGLDTRHLRYGDDNYDLVVTVIDIRGNTSTFKERITVRNVRART